MIYNIMLKIQLYSTVIHIYMHAHIFFKFISIIDYYNVLDIVLSAIQWKKVKVKSISRVRLCNPLDCSLPGSSGHGILQARILEWVPFPFSRGSSQPRGRTWVSCIAGRLFTTRAATEALLVTSLCLMRRLPFSALQNCNEIINAYVF